MHRATPSAFRAALISAATALAALATPAAAQIEDAEPRWVVVTQKDTPARCDDFERFYKVATFQPGRILSVDGESDDWARVAYPPDLHALVPAADARRLDDSTIQLVIDSRLRAPSAVLGIAGSWHSLYAEPIASGTRLTVVGEELGSAGEVAAYRVTPPEPPVAPSRAYAYVKRDTLRDATKSEIEAHLRSIAAETPSVAQPVVKSEPGASPIRTGLPAGVQRVESGAPSSNPAGAASTTSQAPVRDAAPGVSDVTPATTAPGPTTETSSSRPAANSGTVSLIEPMVRPGEERQRDSAPAEVVTNQEWIQPAEPAAQTDATRPAPRTGEPAATTPRELDITARVETPAQPASDSTPTRAASAPAPRSPDPASIEDLESSLNAVRKLDTESQDLALDELLAEFRRTLAAESAKPDADERIIAGLQRRVAWLELRTETRDQRLAIENAMREFSDRDRQLSAQVQRWESDRAYVVVGRLTPSSVYDGKRLPLMYRVQSVDPLVGPRTIAYVRPAQGQSFASRLGQIVGIVGQTADDEALALRIVRPERIDALNAATYAAEPSATD